MKIVLVGEELSDWYSIERAEHDSRIWLENIAPGISRMMASSRLSPEADIEGSKEEMIAIAHAIKNRSSERFKRCAVHFEADGAHFRSPKNSEKDAIVAMEEADELAMQIFAELGQ